MLDALRQPTPCNGIAVSLDSFARGRTKSERSFNVDAVYLQTNDAEENEVVVFRARRRRDAERSSARYATGGAAAASRT